MYVDGKIGQEIIVSSYQTDGYCSCLGDQGYVRAYNVEEYEEAVKEAKEAYDNALELLEIAKKSPLIINKN